MSNRRRPSERKPRKDAPRPSVRKSGGYRAPGTRQSQHPSKERSETESRDMPQEQAEQRAGQADPHEERLEPREEQTGQRVERPPRESSERKSVRSSREWSERREARREEIASRHRPSVAQAEEERFKGVTLDMEGKRMVLTRRHFLYGALGAGAAALVAAGAVLSDSGKGGSDVGIKVDEGSVVDLESFEEVSRDDSFTMLGDYELPFGTLVWANSDDIAACLMPTNQASPLTQVAVMMLASGLTYTLIEGAMGVGEGFEIYDARASSRGIIWIEANALEGKWRVLCAPMNENLSLGNAHIVDEGDSQNEIPTIAAVDDTAWWQVMPSINDENASERTSSVKRIKFAGGNISEAHTAKGRMACPICGSSEGVLVAAHNPDYSRTYDLLMIGNKSGQVEDRLTLPSGMTPNALGWGPNGFSFCFEGIYDFGGGIANLGTYTPADAHSPGSSYDGLTWFRFGRTPTTGPCWCGANWLMVKSTSAVCGVDLARKTYCSLDTASGCTSWGDHLCSTGAGKIAVTAMQINDTSPTGETQYKTQVRVWEANSDIYG